MDKITDSRLKYLKAKSVWPSILYLFSSLIMGAIVVVIATAAVVCYIVESNYVKFRDQVLILEESINDSVASGEDYGKIIADIQREIYHPEAISITDKDNNSKVSYGEKFEISKDVAIDKDNINVINITVIPDELRTNKAGDKIAVSISDILQKTWVIPLEDEEVLNVDNLGKSIYELNYWIKAKLRDGDNIYVKFKQNIIYNDLIAVMITAAFAGIIFVLMVFSHFINMIKNISDQKYVLKLLLKDPITGGKNFLAYENEAKKRLSSHFYLKNSFAVIDLSFGRYQNYCTLYGVPEGEKLLIAMDRYLQRVCGRGEICARVTKADFVLLVKLEPGNNSQARLVDRLNDIIEHMPERLKNQEYSNVRDLKGLNNVKLKAGIYILEPVIYSTINGSILKSGLSVVDTTINRDWQVRRRKNNLDIEQLYIKAGMAKQGILEDSGLKVYNHDMWEKELWEQKVEEKMQEALDNEEFQVYIQPKYNPVSEELVGGEALVRWISPTEGFIPPGKFIPIFEKNGFVTQLDDYMISHTAKLQAKWLEDGKKIVPISVNVSRAHFAQVDLADHIKDLVDVYSLPRKYIEIELTESAFFDDKKILLSTVKQLQEYGFDVSMDDFGSGYSSLNSLKDLPLNVLKLDAEFFRGDDFDTRGEIVVSKAISLAKQLDMKIVAEGVEKKEQVDFLAGQDCDMIQGYYYAKPMPANEYEGRMK